MLYKFAKMRAAIEAIPDEARPALAKQVSDFFLREYDHFMGD